MSVWTRWKTAEGTCITRKSIQEDCAANAHAQQEKRQWQMDSHDFLKVSGIHCQERHTNPRIK